MCSSKARALSGTHLSSLHTGDLFHLHDLHLLVEVTAATTVLIEAGPLWSWSFKPPLVEGVSVGIAEGMQPDEAGSEVFLGHSGGVSPPLLALWTPLHLSVLLTA